MEPSIKITTLFLAVLISGLSAGFFYAWSVSVIPGTKQLADQSYLEAMQSINRAILNPAFFIIFFGGILLLPLTSYMQFRTAPDLSFWLMLAATLAYLAGTFGVTIFGNVPMNESLDGLNLGDLNTEAMNLFRRTFEARWNHLHSIRTVFAVLSFVLCLLAAFMELRNTSHQ